MGVMESIVLVIAVFGIMLGLASPFYTDFFTATGHNSTSVQVLQDRANSTRILQESTRILNNQTQQPETNIFTLSSTLLGIGVGVINLVINTPGTILGLVTGASSILPSGIIPPLVAEFLLVLVTVTVVFAISRFLAGRSES